MKALRRLSSTFLGAPAARAPAVNEEPEISELFKKKCLTRDEVARIKRAMAGNSQAAGSSPTPVPITNIATETNIAASAQIMESSLAISENSTEDGEEAVEFWSSPVAGRDHQASAATKEIAEVASRDTIVTPGQDAPWLPVVEEQGRRREVTTPGEAATKAGDDDEAATKEAAREAMVIMTPGQLAAMKAAREDTVMTPGQLPVPQEQQSAATKAAVVTPGAAMLPVPEEQQPSAATKVTPGAAMLPRRSRHFPEETDDDVVEFYVPAADHRSSATANERRRSSVAAENRMAVLAAKLAGEEGEISRFAGRKFLGNAESDHVRAMMRASVDKKVSFKEQDDDAGTKQQDDEAAAKEEALRSSSASSAAQDDDAAAKEALRRRSSADTKQQDEDTAAKAALRRRSSADRPPGWRPPPPPPRRATVVASREATEQRIGALEALTAKLEEATTARKEPVTSRHDVETESKLTSQRPQLMRSGSSSSSGSGSGSSSRAKPPPPPRKKFDVTKRHMSMPPPSPSPLSQPAISFPPQGSPKSDEERRAPAPAASWTKPAPSTKPPAPVGQRRRSSLVVRKNKTTAHLGIMPETLFEI